MAGSASQARLPFLLSRPSSVHPPPQQQYQQQQQQQQQQFQPTDLSGNPITSSPSARGVSARRPDQEGGLGERGRTQAEHGEQRVRVMPWKVNSEQGRPCEVDVLNPLGCRSGKYGVCRALRPMSSSSLYRFVVYTIIYRGIARIIQIYASMDGGSCSHLTPKS